MNFSFNSTLVLHVCCHELNCWTSGSFSLLGALYESGWSPTLNKSLEETWIMLINQRATRLPFHNDSRQTDRHASVSLCVTSRVTIDTHSCVIIGDRAPALQRSDCIQPKPSFPLLFSEAIFFHHNKLSISLPRYLSLSLPWKSKQALVERPGSLAPLAGQLSHKNSCCYGNSHFTDCAALHRVQLL